MKIVRADVLGFCSGVRKAVTAAEHALEIKTDGNVFTFGPLIHNPVVLASLGKRGLEVLSLSAIPLLKSSDTVLIRAHGVPPETEQLLRNTGCTVINATCPRVTASQRRAADYIARGFTVILAGDQNHGEVTGIAGYAEESLKETKSGGQFILVRNKEEAAGLFESAHPERAVLLSQTTFSPSEFAAIAEILKQKIPSIELFNSICPATRERQDALARLCNEVEGVLVIGGKNSANTNRLFVIAQKLSPHAALIETPDDIPEYFYQLQTVGLTAGASTPDSVIDIVEQQLIAGVGQGHIHSDTVS
jgi:4-hydroxy-3-methylbut-2-en-1-yl diphosphate reductase